MGLYIGSLTTAVQSLLRATGKKSILQTKPQQLKNINSLIYKKNNIVTDNYNSNIAYHGSPYDFEKFDMTKIGQGEGFAKRGRGIYLHRSKRFAPYYANIKSKDAPIHLGCGAKLENPHPTIYKIDGLDKLKLKKVSFLESKSIAKNQDDFERSHPDIDGIDLPNGEICIFPKSIEKLHISQKVPMLNFIKANKGVEFRTWTTDKNKLEMLG